MNKQTIVLKVGLQIFFVILRCKIYQRSIEDVSLLCCDSTIANYANKSTYVWAFLSTVDEHTHKRINRVYIAQSNTMRLLRLVVNYRLPM